jgi:putative serine protease PepD
MDPYANTLAEDRTAEYPAVGYAAYPSYPAGDDGPPAYLPPAPAGPQPPRRSRLGLVAVVAAVAVTSGAVGVVVGDRFRAEPVATTADTGSTTGSPVSSFPGTTTVEPLTTPGNAATVAARVLPSVVSIDVRGGGQSGTGSGVVIRSDGYIVTNNHVAEVGANGGTLRVTFNDGTSASATIVGTDSATDLAVIKTTRTGLRALALGDSSKVRVGDPVLAIGSPLGLSGTVTSGIVSALNRPVNTTDQQSPFGGSTLATVINAIQTDAAINPGNSGGPLVDMTGRVIGINSAIATLSGGGQSGSIGVGFAIPANEVKSITDQLIKGGKAGHALLGVSVNDVTDADGTPHAVIRQVTPGGPAATAGLQVGDMIVAVGGTQIASADALIAAVRSHAPGTSVRVDYLRDGSRRSVTVKLTDASS